jgi:hypothetical protein
MQGLTMAALARHDKVLGKPDPHTRADIVLSEVNELNRTSRTIEPRLGGIRLDVESSMRTVLADLSTKRASVRAARKWILENCDQAELIAQLLRRKLKTWCTENGAADKNKLGVLFVIDDVMHKAHKQGGKMLQNFQDAFGRQGLHEMMKDSVTGLGANMRGKAEKIARNWERKSYFSAEIVSQVKRSLRQPEWIAYKDVYGHSYYQNRLTHEVSWQKPADDGEDEKEEQQPTESKNDSAERKAVAAAGGMQGLATPNVNWGQGLYVESDLRDVDDADVGSGQDDDCMGNNGDDDDDSDIVEVDEAGVVVNNSGGNSGGVSTVNNGFGQRASEMEQQPSGGMNGTSLKQPTAKQLELRHMRRARRQTELRQKRGQGQGQEEEGLSITAHACACVQMVADLTALVKAREAIKGN